ncbi:MAG: DinB family protein [Dehalococcoidia bacterium]
MTDEDLDTIVATLVQSGDRVRARSMAVPATRWDEIVHTGDGPWTRRQLLAHMAANDLRQLVRIRLGAGIAEPGDAEAHELELDTHTWNAARVAERSRLAVPDLLAEMDRNRSALVALIGGLTQEQRSRLMPFRGVPTPLSEMVTGLTGHLESHAEELTRP